MNKLSLVGMQLFLKIYKGNFDVSSEGPSSGVTRKVITNFDMLSSVYPFIVFHMASAF